MNLLVTGGLGFIGSNFIRHILVNRPNWKITNVDKMAYSGNPDNHTGFLNDPRYTFIHGDICDKELVGGVLRGSIDVVVHFAAETHVDRSIGGPKSFVRTNVEGTLNLMECIEQMPKEHSIERFIHISTDEVYGAKKHGESIETDKLDATLGNPYSITKEAADKLVQSYFLHPHHLPTIVIRPTNNYGPSQYPEKFIPLAITNAMEDKTIPVYGDGKQIRDWLFVEDNCSAILAVLEHGKVGDIYNVSGKMFREYTNNEVIEIILDMLQKPKTLISYITDRPHHDVRYHVNHKKITTDTAWEPYTALELGLRKTVEWYKQNRPWWERIKSGKFREWYVEQYKQRYI